MRIPFPPVTYLFRTRVWGRTSLGPVVLAGLVGCLPTAAPATAAPATAAPATAVPATAASATVGDPPPARVPQAQLEPALSEPGAPVPDLIHGLVETCVRRQAIADGMSLQIEAREGELLVSRHPAARDWFGPSPGEDLVAERATTCIQASLGGKKASPKDESWSVTLIPASAISERRVSTEFDLPDPWKPGLTHIPDPKKFPAGYRLNGDAFRAMGRWSSKTMAECVKSLPVPDSAEVEVRYGFERSRQFFEVKGGTDAFVKCFERLGLQRIQPYFSPKHRKPKGRATGVAKVRLSAAELVPALLPFATPDDTRKYLLQTLGSLRTTCAPPDPQDPIVLDVRMRPEESTTTKRRPRPRLTANFRFKKGFTLGAPGYKPSRASFDAIRCLNRHARPMVQGAGAWAEDWNFPVGASLNIPWE